MWALALQELGMQMTRQMFDRWIKPLVLTGLDPNPTEAVGSTALFNPDAPLGPGGWQAAIRCPDDYSRAWCEGRLDVRLRRVLGGILEAPVEIVYGVGERDGG